MEGMNGTKLSYSLRNVEDGQTVSLNGDGEFCIGLTLDESIACCARGEALAKEERENIVVPLVVLTVWRTAGVTVCPASRDLRCVLNGEDIHTEANIIPGNQIEVGDKILELLDTMSAKSGARRHLPPTPGVPILPTPPPKPQRSMNSKSPTIEVEVPEKQKGCDMLREWCLVELPNSEQELLKQAQNSEQLASLASSYLSHHINLHTDIHMSAQLTDSIFKMMQEVAHHRKDILRRFLSDLITEVVEEDQVEDHVHHTVVTTLLVEILRQFLDPGYLVLLCLQLLRALSHIPGMVVTMVTNQTPAAVLGSMAAYKEDAQVQNNCLDILAKMATFMPSLLGKPPMRESSIDLVAMAMNLHAKDLMVVQAAIRTLANLASTLHSLAFAGLIDSPSPDLRVYVSGVMSVLEYEYQTVLPLVRNALAMFTSDLTVKTDGRRFLFEYAKMEQLRIQHNLWESQPESPCRPSPDLESPISEWTSRERSNSWHQNKENSVRTDDKEVEDDGEVSDNDDDGDDDSNDTWGILKKARSFENLRTPDRRVSFVDENDLPQNGNLTDSSTSSDGELQNNTVSGTAAKEGAESPDIQILSRSRICPVTLAVVDSSDSETVNNVLLSNYSDNNSAAAPVKPNRRPIQAPMVHINSTSDSDAEPQSDSASMDSFKYKSITNGLDETDAENNSESVPPPLPPPRKRSPVASEENGLSVEQSGIVPNCSSPSSLVSRSPPVSSECFSVNLEEFQYNAADITFLKTLMSVQIVCHVCSAAVEGSDPPALKLIDMPLSELLSRPGIPPAVCQFAVSQFEPHSTLMDIDPGAVISVIDAVRYKMLAYELVQRNLQMLVQALGSRLHVEMFQLAGEVIQCIVKSTTIVEDPEFVKSLEKELDSILDSAVDPKPVMALLDDLHLMAENCPAGEKS